MVLDDGGGAGEAEENVLAQPDLGHAQLPQPRHRLVLLFPSREGGGKSCMFYANFAQIGICSPTLKKVLSPATFWGKVCSDPTIKILVVKVLEKAAQSAQD